MLNKRAVSPLIATVLLVMIVVSIGAAVMVVIQGLNEEQLQNIQTQEDLLSCSTDVSVKIWEVSNKPRVCLEVVQGSYINITVLMENTGQKDIESFKVLGFGDDGYDTSTWNSYTLAKNAISKFEFKISRVGNTSRGVVDKIVIAPQITGTETVTCELAELTFDEVEIDSLQLCNATSVNWD
jgi:flagellin-like protein